MSHALQGFLARCLLDRQVELIELFQIDPSWMFEVCCTFVWSTTCTSTPPRRVQFLHVDCRKYCYPEVTSLKGQIVTMFLQLRKIDAV